LQASFVQYARLRINTNYKSGSRSKKKHYTFAHRVQKFVNKDVLSNYEAIILRIYFLLNQCRQSISLKKIQFHDISHSVQRGRNECNKFQLGENWKLRGGAHTGYTQKTSRRQRRQTQCQIVRTLFALRDLLAADICLLIDNSNKYTGRSANPWNTSRKKLVRVEYD
jgi:hypothetical protein